MLQKRLVSLNFRDNISKESWLMNTLLRWLPTVAGQIYIDHCGVSSTGKCFEMNDIWKVVFWGFSTAKSPSVLYMIKKFVKPKQYVCFQLGFFLFFDRVFVSFYVCSFWNVFRMSSRNFFHVSNDFMDFSLDYPLFPSVNFFKTTSSCYAISKVRHIRILKKSTNTSPRNRNPRIHQNLNYKPVFKFWYLFPLYINKQLKKF